MQINVTAVGDPWKFDETADPMWTITIEGNGEPAKTYDKALASVGTHEAEEYTAKSGKKYWRTPKQATGGYKGGPKEFKADPAKMKQEFNLEVAKNQSIQRQVALKCAVEIVVSDDGMTAESVDELFNHFMRLLANQWHEENDVIEDAGDFKKINPTYFDNDDLPPVDQLEEPI